MAARFPPPRRSAPPGGLGVPVLSLWLAVPSTGSRPTPSPPAFFLPTIVSSFTSKGPSRGERGECDRDPKWASGAKTEERRGRRMAWETVRRKGAQHGTRQTRSSVVDRTSLQSLSNSSTGPWGTVTENPLHIPGPLVPPRTAGQGWRSPRVSEGSLSPLCPPTRSGPLNCKERKENHTYFKILI